MFIQISMNSKPQGTSYRLETFQCPAVSNNKLGSRWTLLGHCAMGVEVSNSAERMVLVSVRHAARRRQRSCHASVPRAVNPTKCVNYSDFQN
jgi:hypothetical protein